MQFDAQFREQLEAIVTQAGKQLLAHQKSADTASEQYLIKELSALLPEASWLAEESGVCNKQSDYCWIIDPLDGTTNYVHGFPHFAVSVALTYQGIPQIGVIYDPTCQELFYAHKGHGAWVNGERITRSSHELARKLILIATPYTEDSSYAARVSRLLACGAEHYAFRYTGSIALDCAYVAGGRADGLFFMDLNWWDIAAGILILQEAGMQVTGDGAEPTVGETYPALIAGSKKLVSELSAIIGHES